MNTELEFHNREMRLVKLLPRGVAYDLVLLKGHLLIEELLTEILISSLNKSNPINIKIGNATNFNQKLNLCWALNKNDINETIWESLKELNSIRNSMAHEVEPKGIDEKINKFSTKVLNNSKFKPSYYKGDELKFSLSWLYLVLSSHIHAQKNS